MECFNRDQGMPVIWSGVDDNIGSLGFDAFAVVLVHLGLVIAQFVHFGFALFELVFIHVTKGGYRHLSAADGLPQDIKTPPAATDEYGLYLAGREGIR